jgi:polyvinyl alcohol dehydrogenase (cytochrome)
MMKLAFAAALVAVAAAPSFAQAPPQDTKTVFETNCGFCHNTGENGAPLTDALRKLDPVAVVEKMTTGTMAGFAGALDEKQKREVAAFVTGKPLPASGELPEVKPK